MFNGTQYPYIPQNISKEDLYEHFISTQDERYNLPNIPLNKMPKRLGELDKSKLIIPAPSHKERAAMARLYLVTKGFNARYLEDGAGIL